MKQLKRYSYFYLKNNYDNDTAHPKNLGQV